MNGPFWIIWAPVGGNNPLDKFDTEDEAVERAAICAERDGRDYYVMMARGVATLPVPEARFLPYMPGVAQLSPVRKMGAAARKRFVAGDIVKVLPNQNPAISSLPVGAEARVVHVERDSISIELLSGARDRSVHLRWGVSPCEIELVLPAEG